jgi:5'-3' exonuclease
VPSYKAHRLVEGTEDTETTPDALAIQVPVLLEVLAALGIATMGAQDYEADDVIGTLATRERGPADIVTGDRDLFQLVDDARPVRVLYVARGVGNHEIVDDAWVQSKYGIPARGYVDYATLRGDASDGLPGVAGIGEKTAASLINSYGTLDGIIAAASDPKSAVSGAIRSKLGKAIDYLAVAPIVVAVARDLDLGVSWEQLEIPAAPRNPQRFAELTETLGLSGSAARVLASLADNA